MAAPHRHFPARPLRRNHASRPAGALKPVSSGIVFPSDPCSAVLFSSVPRSDILLSLLSRSSILFPCSSIQPPTMHHVYSSKPSRWDLQILVRLFCSISVHRQPGPCGRIAIPELFQSLCLQAEDYLVGVRVRTRNSPAGLLLGEIVLGCGPDDLGLPPSAACDVRFISLT